MWLRGKLRAFCLNRSRRRRCPTVAAGALEKLSAPAGQADLSTTGELREFPMVHGYHLILPIYGFWRPNDPRGSWSRFVAKWEIARFGEPRRTFERRCLRELSAAKGRHECGRPNRGRSFWAVKKRSRTQYVMFRTTRLKKAGHYSAGNLLSPTLGSHLADT